MRILEFELVQHANAYIVDWILKKWRYDNPDKFHMDSKLSMKQYLNEPLTQEDLEYIMNFNNVVIVEKGYVRFHRFSGLLSRR